jgi:hypothetical protein
MQRTLFGNGAARGLIVLTALAESAIHSEAATPVPLSAPTIDGTFWGQSFDVATGLEMATMVVTNK